MIAAVEPEIGDVYAVVEEVWSTFLGTDEPILPEVAPVDRPQEWTAMTTVGGAWEGAVLVAVTDRLARDVAAAMLALDPADLAPEDVSDALGELVNVIGGNVKSLMPGPSTLSLPLVASGAVPASHQRREVCRLDLSWRRQSLCVSVCVPTGASPEPGPTPDSSTSTSTSTSEETR
ncbi:chemotaxis protein CheX [Nocardioides kribbensis]|uniref:Chemotaxis protein CheX n=1 Tax=Nocardioides kribbensis TaxID=305517 RepID=A0ABV1NX37_9ACTN